MSQLLSYKLRGLHRFFRTEIDWVYCTGPSGGMGQGHSMILGPALVGLMQMFPKFGK